MHRAPARWILFPAVTMSLGWGLRGYIGGGPLGAMIPGAMVALALCLLLRRKDGNAAWIAACGAVGVGFGGQETYGQTVGFSLQPETMLWGLAGLGLKGAVWGLLGGAVLGMALVRDAYGRREILLSLGLMLAGTQIGWKLINQPKLLYFSNRLDRPREEIWAGLLLGGILLLAGLRRHGTPLRMALWGTLGGGIGFFAGGAVQALGRLHAPDLTRDYWKLMEFTFGFCFGAALGRAAWRERDTALPSPGCTASGWTPLLAAAVLAALAISEKLPSRFDYTILGAGLVAAAWWSAPAARQIAITMTCAAFFVDFAQNRPEQNQVLLGAGAAALTAAVALWTARAPSVTAMFRMVTLAAVGTSYLKAFALGAGQPWPVAVEVTFTVLAVVAMWLAGDGE